MKRLKNVFLHPLTAVAFLVSAVGQLSIGWIEPAWALVSTTSTYWFPAVATTATTLLPEIGYGALGSRILIAAAIVFVGVQLDRLIQRVQTFFDNR
ncbi:hypothetical protein [Haloarcula pellucida]|uniref:Potassium channel domain-containing protein n=1 Tax=Haloarcula pellucida TaxID=1427151 RepID=A0A830GKW9_9EURY|nr:hypothetical protein [Halomicroarcula pellucida]MBX0348677.1 hypothetical protein [Halomicroarcula pellucida]GGN92264.1 hypothetical protein GCM10009030_16320 [Halomicroarcula pellucida]